jgi:PEP-CTERM motif
MVIAGSELTPCQQEDPVKRFFSLLAMALACATAGAQTVTFDQPPADYSGPCASGYAVCTNWDGFLFSYRAPFAQFTVADGFNGTKALFNVGGSVALSPVITRADGQTFSLQSFDFSEGAAFSGSASAVSYTTIDVFGTRADGSTVSASFAPDRQFDGFGPLPDYQTAVLSSFSDLVSVEIGFRQIGEPPTINNPAGFLINPSLSFDNVALSTSPVTPVPEPATAVLMLASLVGVGAAARRRRRST